MAWIILIFAGMGEVVGVLGLNRLNRRRNAASWTMMLGGFAVSFILLTIAMKSLSMGTAYAVWTAIGTIGATVLGMVFYGESRQPLRIFFLVLVVGAVIGLKALE
ncbi:DMT family transporter [Cohnella nanjingensis]|uniref:Multidrug efflux SMR transporter n=1 Tax=Cohnella nanjingensis TaxID=1387779 RepID=A0A7X0VGB7_9BACL|nr:multidrug efflux SMR transporter [Cohnella nanjingensis]MBB6671484.1 multidrug efflux SMR transporter [Cohnella nanjingensis]